jgi:hypothetical protein
VIVDVTISGRNQQASGCGDGQLPFQVAGPNGIAGRSGQPMSKYGSGMR